MRQEYKTYLNIGNQFKAIGDSKTIGKLPPGIYHPEYDGQTGETTFHKFENHHDGLVDLPGTAYDNVMKEIETFFSQGTLTKFKECNLLHKMNILLHGKPGTGKTCLVNRITNFTIDKGGIVLFNPHPVLLSTFFTILDELQPDTQVLVIYEELDQLIQEYDEKPFLNILDGEVQKKNAMFIATTNYYDRIPDRIKRPGRFALRVEVGFPGADARYAYLNSKLNNNKLANQLTELTEGFTIDHLKEVVRDSYCMGKDANVVINKLRDEFKITNDGPGVIVEELDEDDEEYNLSTALRSLQLKVGKAVSYKGR